MFCRVRRGPVAAAVLVAAGLALTSPSVHAFLTLAPAEESRLSVHAVRAALLPGPRWVIELEIEGRGVLLAPRAETPPPPAEALDHLAHLASPRLVALAPWDPCEFGIESYARVAPRTLDRPWALGPRQWPTEWPRPSLERTRGQAVEIRFANRPAVDRYLATEALVLPEEDRAALVGRTRIAVRVEAPERRWTAPLAVPAFAGRDGTVIAPVDRLAEAAATGKAVRFELLDVGTGLARAPAPVVDLPTGIALPEIAYEHPLDTEAAIARQLQRVHQRPVRAFLVQHERWPTSLRNQLGAPAEGRLTVARFLFERSRGDPAIALRPTPFESPLEPVWLVHRPWRGRIDCPERRDYLYAVAKQQGLAHRLFATASGRRLEVVVGLARERGYLLEPFGNPGRAAAAEAGLRPVEVDRSAWGGAPTEKP